ncbi:MAG: hypothetical protein IKW62_02725 [Clostridia bacterium]|nr:hypothetical protein [Clostridia bacterium]
MYIFKQSIFEICKTFLISIVCSVIFALMIYRESALPNSFICLVLNTAALLLFLYLHYLNWVRLYERSFNATEYFVPALSAVGVYAAVSSYFYSKRFIFYMWLFLPSRFLEPKLNSDFAFVSVIVAHLLFLGLVFMTPPLMYRKS